MHFSGALLPVMPAEPGLLPLCTGAENRNPLTGFRDLEEYVTLYADTRTL